MSDLTPDKAVAVEPDADDVEIELVAAGVLSQTKDADGRGSNTPAIARLDPGAKRTLYDLKRAGTPANTLRALASDLRYLNAWHRACGHGDLPVPTPPETVLTFVAHHLYDPDLRDGDDYGMPPEVERRLRESGVKAKDGPVAPSTVNRRLATLGRVHREYDLEDPTRGSGVREHVKQALKGGNRSKTSRRKSETAATSDVILPMLRGCEEEVEGVDVTAKDRLRARRDRALLSYMWASGGRRRSEAEALTCDCLHAAPGGFTVELRETKTIKSDGVKAASEFVPLLGEAATAMRSWLAAAEMDAGDPVKVFRAIDRFGRVRGGLTGHSINAIVKERAARAGVDPDRISAHGLRAGFATESLRRGTSIADTMAMTTHRDVRSLQAYWKGHEALKNPAATLLDAAGEEGAETSGQN
ncbi:hypothetical protein CKO28_14275 [Rhodovibrio sodomensis]|uniref:Tyr recombinase domain-containing protein n=1 Tax=Rhodovibrio sodomensis TaxID=1088 RepID=A0ABS1DIH9_9PROT|nr:tyrosine-type recombinase/integrase [Rhodovibrio sodomensis]MBK1669200.1 hypothetical protein [Rhodovibrio sodomensis]